MAIDNESKLLESIKSHQEIADENVDNLGWSFASFSASTVLGIALLSNSNLTGLISLFAVAYSIRMVTENSCAYIKETAIVSELRRRLDTTTLLSSIQIQEDQDEP